MPSQERGRKPARALPYRVAVSAGFAAPGQLRIRLSDEGTSGAPFAICGYAGELLAPKHVFVAPGTTDTTTLTVPTARWDVAVQGPNRFWYELAGSATGDASDVDVRTLIGLRRGSLSLELVNEGDHTLTLDVRSQEYRDQVETLRLAAGQTRRTSVPTAQGWYDVVVTAREDRSFRRRITGRVENGRGGVTA